MSDIRFVVHYGPEKHRKDFTATFKRWEFWGLIFTLNIVLVAESLTIVGLLATR